MTSATLGLDPSVSPLLAGIQLTGTGTFTAVPAPCLVEGTRVCTPRGEVRVEDLAIGDLVVTASGEQRPIKWLGHRVMDCKRHSRPDEVMPVRIAAHAFGDNRPLRDLWVSPGHAICVDAGGEVLVPAISLTNGTTIRQETVDTVTYWHVELDAHDIVLAENLPTESYIDVGNRTFFAQSGVVILDSLPDMLPATTDDYCRPFHAAGFLVEAIREQLRLRAKVLATAPHAEVIQIKAA